MQSDISPDSVCLSVYLYIAHTSSHIQSYCCHLLHGTHLHLLLLVTRTRHHCCSEINSQVYQKRSEWSEQSFYSIFPKLPSLIFLCRKLLQHEAFFSGHLQQQNWSHIHYWLCEGVFSRVLVLELLTIVQGRCEQINILAPLSVEYSQATF